MLTNFLLLANTQPIVFTGGVGIFCLRGVSIMAFWTETEKEKFQLRGSDNLFDDFLLY